MPMIFNKTTEAILRQMLNGHMDFDEGLNQLSDAGAVPNGYMNDALLPNPTSDDEE
jgi:hypothetical protein